MTDTNRPTPTSTSADQWTSVQAYVLAVICLVGGIAGGWFMRGLPESSGVALSEAVTLPNLAPLRQAAEKLGVAFDFGWRSGLPLR
jgi:hypothetical protein